MTGVQLLTLVMLIALACWLAFVIVRVTMLFRDPRPECSRCHSRVTHAQMIRGACVGVECGCSMRARAPVYLLAEARARRRASHA